MMKNFHIIVLCICMSVCKFTANAAEADSLHIATPPVHADDVTEFNAKKLILPAALITVGTIGAATDWLHTHVDMEIRDGFDNWRGDKRWHGDDFIQYLPAAAHLGLGLCGVKSKHSFRERFAVLATSALTMAAVVNAVKYSVKQPRPTGKKNSFPSGHTATAFMGAELVRLEYKDTSPWYGVGAYAVATGVAFMRLYNERHWLSDVLAGAGVGILSAHVGYWLLPLERKLFRWDKTKATTVAAPFYDPFNRGGGVSFAMSF